MRPFVLAAVASLAVCAPLAAQEPLENYSSTASYMISVPTGDTRDLLTSLSWVGIAWEGLWAVGPATSAGVLIGVNDFDHSSFGTANFPWGATTGQHTRMLVATTAMASGRWYPSVVRERRLHVGLAAGLVYTSETYRLGLSESVQGAAHFAIAPEAGWAFPLVNGVDGVVTARYTLPTSNGNYLGGARRYPFAALSLGVVER